MAGVRMRVSEEDRDDEWAEGEEDEDKEDWRRRRMHSNVLFTF